MPASDEVNRITRVLMDEGKIVEAGWVSYRAIVMPATCSDVQVAETRKAFFAGAHHLFASIFMALEPGTEPTERDLVRLDRIHSELEAFAAAVAAPTTHSAPANR